MSLPDYKRRPTLGDTRNLPDHYARVAFKCFDDICDAFEKTNEHVTAGSLWREMLYIRMVGQEFQRFVDLYMSKADRDPVLAAELTTHRNLLSEIGLLS